MGRQFFSAPFLLLFLFMVLMPATGNALPTRNPLANDISCECVSVTSAISPRFISSVHLIQSSPRCNVLQVIATLKNGRKVCLDLAVQWVKRIVQVMLNRENH